MEVRSRRWSGARELGLFVLAYVTYFGVRAVTEGRAPRALHNALSLIRFERRFGLSWEHGIQTAVLGSRALVDAADAVYMYGHWPVLIAAGVLLFRYRRAQYYTLRNACLLTGLIGLVIFAVFPVAPPRLTDLPLVDTVTRHAAGYRQIIPASLVNEYAAMPSFHAGWTLLVGIVVFRATRNRLVRAFAVAMPAAMAFAVVATANHYVIDVIAGAAVAVAGLLVVDAHEARRAAPRIGRDGRHERPVLGRPPRGQRPVAAPPG